MVLTTASMLPLALVVAHLCGPVCGSIVRNQGLLFCSIDETLIIESDIDDSMNEAQPVTNAIASANGARP